MAIKDWFTRERPADWEGMRRGIKTYSGVIFLRNTLGFLIKWTVGLALFLLVLFVVLGGLVFVVRVFSTGTSDVMITKISVALDNIPAGQAIKGAFSNIFGVIWNPEQIFTDPKMKSEVDKNTNKKLGVSFTKFDADPGRFIEGDDFMTYGMVEITPFEETPLNIEFKCDVEGKACEKATPSKLSNIIGPETRSSTVSCRCNSGEAGKNVDGKVVTLKANYNFITKGYMPIYIIGSAKLEGIRSKGGNPFAGISNPNLDENNGVVTSTYTNGPLKLAMGGYYSQPFTEAGPDYEEKNDYYIINIELSRKLSATGIPSGMKSFRMIVPDFGDVDVSDGLFASKGKNADGFKIYEMAKKSLDDLNSPCKKMLFIVDDLTNPDCRKIWEKGFLPIHVRFRINGDSDADLSQSFIIVEAEYNYEESIPKDIVVIKKPAGGVQPPTGAGK